MGKVSALVERQFPARTHELNEICFGFQQPMPVVQVSNFLRQRVLLFAALLMLLAFPVRGEGFDMANETDIGCFSVSVQMAAQVELKNILSFEATDTELAAECVALVLCLCGGKVKVVGRNFGHATVGLFFGPAGRVVATLLQVRQILFFRGKRFPSLTKETGERLSLVLGLAKIRQGH